MKLYTLISIALGVFGGTYTALAALGKHFDPWISEARANAVKHCNVVCGRFAGSDSTTARSAKTRNAKINRWAKVWVLVNIVPAACFFCLVFAIAFWVLSDWTGICTQADGQVVDYTAFPWSWFRVGLAIMVFIDLICVLLAGMAWAQCRAASHQLFEQYNTAQEINTQSVEALPSSSAKS